MPLSSGTDSLSGSNTDEEAVPHPPSQAASAAPIRLPPVMRASAVAAAAAAAASGSPPMPRRAAAPVATGDWMGYASRHPTPARAPVRLVPERTMMPPRERVHLPDGASDEDKARIQEIVTLVNKLNGYRTAYQGKIAHQFRPTYTTGMGLEMLRAEYEQVYSLVCAGKMPEVLRMVVTTIAETFVKAHHMMGQGHLVSRRLDFEQMFKAEMQQGAFDDEFMQLEIEYANYFSAGPVKRFLSKAGRVYGTALRVNIMSDDDFSAMRSQHAAAMEQATKEAAGRFPARRAPTATPAAAGAKDI